VNAEIKRLLQIVRQRGQHGDAAADGEAAHDCRDAEHAELASEIERARTLVRLRADQADHAAAGGTDTLTDAVDIDDGVALVASLNLDFNIWAEHVLACALLDEPVDAGEAVRR